MKQKTNYEIMKEVRRSWNRNPTTRVKDSDKLYDRQKVRKNTKEMIDRNTNI